MRPLSAPARQGRLGPKMVACSLTGSALHRSTVGPHRLEAVEAWNMGSHLPSQQPINQASYYASTRPSLINNGTMRGSVATPPKIPTVQHA